MDFNPNAGAPISYDDAKKLIAAFKAKYPGQTEAVYLGRETFERALAVPNAAGIRAYFGLTPEGYTTLILVPTDKDNNSITSDGGGTTLGEYGQPCPPVCAKGF
ncbi:MAG: hypothetical protein WDO15_11230 [Bacteroidota bacterium]